MPISGDLIYRQLVQVRWEDTVRAVCDRVASLYPRNPLQAYIWLAHPDGGYALASMFDLDRKAGESGFGILQKRLGELPELFPRQSGVEREGPLWDRQARQEARRLGGRLLVLEQGQVIGCVRDERGGVASRPQGAFRLFDPPIPLDRLEETPCVVATYDTSVSAALALLADQKGSKEPFIAFPDPRKGREWFVFRENDVQAVLARDRRASGWALAHLREAGPRRCQAVVYDEVGEKQAAELCADQRCLVVLYQGQPKLMIPDPTYRGAGRQPVTAESLAMPDLVFVQQQATAKSSVAPGRVVVQPAERYVNLWFEESRAKEEALVFGRTYHLTVNVGEHDARSIVDWDREVRPPPIVEPPETREQQPARLYVSVFSLDFAVAQPTQLLALPAQGNSEPVQFVVRPVRRTFGQHDRARLDVCLYYRCNLVQSFRVEVEVLAEGDQARTPKHATLVAARVEDYPALDQVTPKDLNLTITRRADGAYQFTFTLAPEAVADPRWDEIKLGCHVDLSRDDLTHLITKARRQLYNVVQAYDLIEHQDRRMRNRAFRALAQVGRQLHQKLFATDDARVIAAWMREHAPPGSTIQVVDRAGDFVFPWSLVYEAAPWDDEKPVEVEQFWGWRYKLAIATDELTATYGQAGEQIVAPDGLKIMVGLYARLKGAREQHRYFSELGKLPDGHLQPVMVDRRSEAVAALKAADQHLVYFFCHGYTEKMANDIQLDDNLVREFTRLAADALEQQDEAEREHLEDLFDVSDSWLRLTRGKLPLAMLQEVLAGVKFTRHPLVFLNMCQSAQVLPSLSGGLIPFFIRMGARAVMGTECSMNMVFGDRFARAFVDRFLRGQPAAEILWRLRQEFLGKGDPLALAYTLFGDADLRLQEPALLDRAQE